MKQMILLFVALLLPFGQTAYADKKINVTLTITVKASPQSDFQTTLQLQGDRMIYALLNSKKISATHASPLSDTYITIQLGEQRLRYIVDPYKNIFTRSGDKKLVLSNPPAKKLRKYVQLVRDQHYGDIVSWKKANKLLPLKSTFEVTDVITGKSFDVQRRAGKRHADVQPLTRQDTKIMKGIYDGKWSWKRRAILIHTDNKTIAASMHGMPHGAGALQNGFPGHFCIHFYQSTTHSSRKVDPTHDIMVARAAGNIDDYLTKATPYELINAFLLAVNQQDMHLLHMTMTQYANEKTEAVIEKLKNIGAIAITSPLKEEDVTGLVAVEVPFDVRLYRQGIGEEKASLSLIVRRHSPLARWRIDVNSVFHDESADDDQ